MCSIDIEFNIDQLQIHNDFKSPKMIDGVKYLLELKHIQTQNKHNKILSTKNIKSNKIIDIDTIDTNNLNINENKKTKKNDLVTLNGSNDLRSWSKLTTAQKYKHINNFIELLTNNVFRQKELRYLLCTAISEQKITKSNDVEYDQEVGKLVHIFKLYKDNDIETGNEKYYISDNILPKEQSIGISGDTHQFALK
jgi:hypothetical protein